MSKVIIYGEIKGGKLKKTAFELASAGRKIADELGGDLGAVLIGAQVEQFAPELAKYGTDVVYAVEAPELEAYNSEYFAQALAQVIGEKQPEIVLLSHTMQGKDLGPRIAAKLGVASIADCVSFELNDGKLVGKRPMYAGKCSATWAATRSPQMASARPNTPLKGFKVVKPVVFSSKTRRESFPRDIGRKMVLKGVDGVISAW